MRVDPARRPLSGTAIALTAKSRWARSSSIVGPWSGDTSPTQRAVARDRAPRAELLGELEGRAAARLARSPARASSGEPVDRQVHVPDRPAEQRVAHRAAHDPRAVSGRPAPRGRRGRPPPRAALRGSRVLPPHPRGEPARDLVVDRADRARDLLRQDPLVPLRADQHGRLARPRRRSRGRGRR